jgi:hypothetical protein
MKYYLLDPVGNLDNTGYCFTDNTPDGDDLTAYDLKTGDRLKDEYPDGIGDVSLKLGEDYPGLECASYLGNTNMMLIVNLEAAAIIQSHDVGEVETVPFKLKNHKGRVHYKDYVFLNPVGVVDCLDPGRSKMDVDEDDGTVMNVTEFVLSKAKLPGTRQLFRPKEDPSRYVFGEKLVADLAKKGCTNFVFEQLECV